MWRGLAAGMVLTISACAGPSSSPRQGGASPDTAQRPSTDVPQQPPCRFRGTGFYAGVNPPRQISRVEPDLSGLPTVAGEAIAIVEVRIAETGAVTETCMLRGVREDVDSRVLKAVQEWRFEPPRLKASLELRGTRMEAGTPVPIFMTVTVRLH